MKKIAFYSATLGAAALAAVALTAAAADVDKTVAQKNGWANYQTEINRVVDKVNAKCGSKLSASYAKSTYLQFDPIQDRTQSACEHAVGALESICTTEPGKQAARSLKTAVCEFSTKGTGVAVDSGTLKIRIDPANSSITGKQPGSYSWKTALEEVL